MNRPTEDFYLSESPEDAATLSFNHKTDNRRKTLWSLRTLISFVQDIKKKILANVYNDQYSNSLGQLHKNASISMYPYAQCGVKYMDSFPLKNRLMSIYILPTNPKIGTRRCLSEHIPKTSSTPPQTNLCGATRSDPIISQHLTTCSNPDHTRQWGKNIPLILQDADQNYPTSLGHKTKTNRKQDYLHHAWDKTVLSDTNIGHDRRPLGDTAEPHGCQHGDRCHLDNKEETRRNHNQFSMDKKLSVDQSQQCDDLLISDRESQTGVSATDSGIQTEILYCDMFTQTDVPQSEEVVFSDDEEYEIVSEEEYRSVMEELTGNTILCNPDTDFSEKMSDEIFALKPETLTDDEYRKSLDDLGICVLPMLEEVNFLLPRYAEQNEKAINFPLLNNVIFDLQHGMWPPKPQKFSPRK